MEQAHIRIGEVSVRTGLSLRTIRWYDEVGLVVPSARSRGGFRLYTEADVQRLNLIKQMKPLEFSLQEMRDLLGVVDRLAATDDAPARAALRDRLEMYQHAVAARIDALREQLTTAERFAAQLRSAAGQAPGPADAPGRRAHGAAEDGSSR
ncbi:MerR family transcriptional regulator [Actinocatenispora thailandica]|uniref:MerR family transcriptional regulator n=1 Tax=Actinocatenispora thailandica TaxID=227318 RepID=A0A7R7DSW7_9ACTN|nr:MerR family transcriptional regulator [Actinocatenispora thailandica]BCJ37259.1 MerR family transcriptional regulator [Actinocatenispora thailandica]